MNDGGNLDPIVRNVVPASQCYSFYTWAMGLVVRRGAVSNISKTPSGDVQNSSGQEPCRATLPGCSTPGMIQR